MTRKPHILHLGFHPVFKRAADFENYQVSVIVHTFLAERMDKSLKDQFTGFGILDVPHNMNLNEYDEAMDQIVRIADLLAEQYGPFEAIVGLFEHVTLPAAKLRERYGLAGTTTETATLCRDKVLMKGALRDSSVRFPQFLAVDSGTRATDIADFLAEMPGRVVLKPRSQAASEGVEIFENAAACSAWLAENRFVDGFEIEEFIDGKICHFDGVVRDGELLFFSAAQYLASCFDFVHNGQPLGAVTIDDPDVFRKAKEFTVEVLQGVKLQCGVFHLEAFLEEDGSFVFLEIGNRFGGAGVSPMVEKVYGVDLIDEALRVDLRTPSKIEKAFTVLEHPTNRVAAWLYMPISTKERCRVRGIDGLGNLPGSIFYSELPTIGQWYNEYAMPFPASGRFMLKGESSATVKADCETIVAEYRVNFRNEKDWPV